MRRRDFLTSMLSAAGGTMLCSCGAPSGSAPVGRRGRVLILAFDGLDPRIVRQLMAQRRLPGFARVASEGSFKAIASSSPPQTPVAFSNIISGADPGSHSIFDFIHRDPNPAGTPLAVMPYFSMSAASDPASAVSLPLGRWRLPLSGGEMKQLRRGPEFWDYLVKRGADVSVYDMPATYPPPEVQGKGRFRCVSGMGTPDLLGGYGEFTMLDTDAPLRDRLVGGGRFVHLAMRKDRATATLQGPENFLLEPQEGKRPEKMTVELSIVRDPDHDVAKIEVGDRMVLLNAGEWSDWVQLDFETGMPGSTALSAAGAPTSIRGMVRFYLKEVRPGFKLYVSPINIDPSDPINPISSPSGLSKRIAKRDGLYYTAGIPEDTKALSHGALNEDEFRQQAYLVLEERAEQCRHALGGFGQGCMLAYFGTPDLVQHMFWRDRDPQHPGRLPEQGDRYRDVIDDLYVACDGIVAQCLPHLRDEDTLIILSDHGFTTFRRGFSVNTWLVENGYMKVRDPGRMGQGEMFVNTDWSRTRAYAMGLNSLYVNLRGREKYGTVGPGRKRAVMDEVAQALLGAKDDDGSAVVARVEIVEDVYPNADATIAPDMVVGYADGYRSSWDTALGGMPEQVIEDNLDRWSGTHCIAAGLVPGMLITNQPVVAEQPALWDIAPTVLDLFGIATPPEMRGRPLFREA
ncbi:MAG: alkaline phosphatase family protein [Planctomycetota bacterium]|jgi:predicted AlkP superfamily phosphohydrolase/phosphomutase